MTRTSRTVALPSGVGSLAPFVDAGVFLDSEVQLAAVVQRLAVRCGHEASDLLILGVAVAARGPRFGHVRVDLDTIADLHLDDHDEPAEVPWPDPQDWRDALNAAPWAVSTPHDAHLAPLRPLVFDGRNLYLQRYFIQEQRVGSDLLRRAGTEGLLGWSEQAIDTAIDRFFKPSDQDADAETPDWQRSAARGALSSPFSVLAGGPGTGKTRTIARMLATAQSLALDAGRPLLVGLAAPSGKAAARMNEAISSAIAELTSDELISDELAEVLRSAQATTIHRMLGANPRKGFARDRFHPVPFDIVVVDETSMVSLPLMAQLLDAVSDRTHLVLVGDPDQLASVEAGTVMGDVVGPCVDDPTTGGSGTVAANGPLQRNVTVLRVARRFGTDSGIAKLAAAVRRGDPTEVLATLRDDRNDVGWIEHADSPSLTALIDEVTDTARQAVLAAQDGEVEVALEALSSLKVLAATHRQQLGVADWRGRIEERLIAEGLDVRSNERWYVGRPIIVTRNDRLNGLANGDVGITIATDDSLAVAFEGNSGERRIIPTARLDHIDTWWSMTIHKSQGSEFGHAIVSLPRPSVPILTRELLYTGITRARDRVTIIGSEESVVAATQRRVARASGLRERLWPEP